MKQFQLSVFYRGSFLSYDITTEDMGLFCFTLKSAPENAAYAPVRFTISHTNRSWTFDPALDANFEKSVVHTLRKINA